MIQAAINAASDGDTIFVRNGTYYEHVIGKGISLIGEDRRDTIIDGSGTLEVIDVSGVGNVALEGLTLQNSQNCIILRSDDNVSIQDCNTKNNNDGIDLYFTKHALIENCAFENNSNWGIWSSGPEYHVSIFNNTIFGASYGIFLWDAFNSMIANNIISNCTEIGIESKADCDVIGNTVSFCHGGTGRGIQIQ